MFAVQRRSSGFAVALAGLILTSQGWAAPRPQTIARSDSDCTLAALARQALLDDVELGTLNLGVSVNDRVATVWGSVPSQAVARRAAECLRRVQGIARVVNQVAIESPADPLFESLHLPPRSLESTLTAPAHTRTSLGPASVPTRAPAVDTQSAVAPPRPSAQSVARTDVPVMPTLSLPATPPPAQNLTQSIAALQTKNMRLCYVRPEVRDHVVYLRGFVYQWEELLALARQISLLPGVERVVLQDVRTIRP